MKEHKIMNCLELRLENLVYNKHGEIHSIRPNDFYHWNQPKMDMDYGFHGIHLTPEILEKAGFYQLPHFTVQNLWNKELGRGRFLSIACAGTPNEMVFITEEDAPKVKNIIVARNYDYDGKTYLHQIQNLYFALTGEELNTEKINNYE